VGTYSDFDRARSLLSERDDRSETLGVELAIMIFRCKVLRTDESVVYYCIVNAEHSWQALGDLIANVHANLGPGISHIEGDFNVEIREIKIKEEET